MSIKSFAFGVVGAVVFASAAQAQQAVQWKVSDGGNGHWYQRVPGPVTWPTGRNICASAGGHLATVTSSAENNFVAAANAGTNAFLGAERSASCGGCFVWVTGEPWVYTNWLPGEPNNNPNEPYLQYWQQSAGWNDMRADFTSTCICEWEADCNSDNIVDYGQILSGALPDSNQNGVLDCCENGGTCCVGDIFRDGLVNGGDLGILLSYWGPVTSAPASQICDLNDDAMVNGGDLGILLANWGTCPN